MGRQGAINTFLQKIGVIDQPLDILAFSNFSVVLFMIQLYVLFMITPLFFMLAQVDRSAVEAARDLGASWWGSFREVILPQAMPGVVIGSIFIFVLSMGEYGTVRIVGGNAIASVGTIVQNQYFQVQYPTAAASAVFLVLAMMAGIFVISASQPARGVVGMDRGKWSKRALAVYFVIFLIFLYGPILVMAVLSFQGCGGRFTFPIVDPGTGWYQNIFNPDAPLSQAPAIRRRR
jgi:ABC-type spermidine/putrescine transport system permease subunit I